jgi:putative Holliday junction resolvase
VRIGRRLAFDVGQARTGVAVSSHDGIFASPVGNIESVQGASALCAEYDPIELYVGLPLSLSGNHTASTENALAFATELAEITGRSVRLIDERLTTTSAQMFMRAAGKNAKQAKSGIDAAAATLILEQALASEKAGNLPGKSLEEYL